MLRPTIGNCTTAGSGFLPPQNQASAARCTQMSLKRCKGKLHPLRTDCEQGVWVSVGQAQRSLVWL